MGNAEHVERAAQTIKARLPDAVVDDYTMKSGWRTLVVRKERLLDVLKLAKDELEFLAIYDITAADFLEHEPYFHVIYVLHSPTRLAKLVIKVKLEREQPVLPSATAIWPGANWFERELYDLFGIKFEGHPNLKRILMPDEWIGHPLRKDYPLTEEPVEFKGHVPKRLPSEVIPKQYE